MAFIGQEQWENNKDTTFHEVCQYFKKLFLYILTILSILR